MRPRPGQRQDGGLPQGPRPRPCLLSVHHPSDYNPQEEILLFYSLTQET